MAEGAAACPLELRGVKEEEEEGEGRPKEEEEPTLPCGPPPAGQEDTPTPFPTSPPPPSAAGRRKRDRASSGAGQDGATAPLWADRRKSKVWNYYTQPGDAYVECNVCKKQLSFHNSTTTMREHLVRRHGIREAFSSPLRDERGAEAEEPPKRRRPTPPESGFRPSRDPRNDAATELVLEMILRDLQPLSVVKDRGLGLLVGYLDAGFSLPSPERLGDALRRRYAGARRELERRLGPAGGLVASAEFWSSGLRQGYVTVAAQFVDGEWRRARCVLATRRAPEAPGGGFGEKLRGVFAEFGLAADAVFGVVHDGPWEARGWRGFPCAARGLHLCVKAGLEVRQVREVLSLARGIVGYFRHDAEAAGSLKGKLEVIHKSRARLVADTESRWISTAEMLENLLELKWAVMAVLEEQPEGSAAVQNLADHQWKLLQELVGVLRTVRIAAAFLGEEQNVSVSSLLPCVHGLAAAIGAQARDAGAAVREVVGAIRAELTRRWGLAEEEKALENPAVIAAFLDPRFKELRFLSPGSRRELHRRVKDMLSGLCHPQPPPAAPFWAPDGDPKARSGGEADEGRSKSIYDVLLGEDPAESVPEVHRQLENYVVEPLCKRGADPLRWWERNERRFPAVARLSRQYLAVPATAVLPQRAFAASQGVLERRRAGLEPENLDQILFLHHNLDFLEELRSRNEVPQRSLH